MLAAALLFASLGDFPLESGKTIQNCQVGYRTFGKLNADKSNAILFPSWFNGTSQDLEQYLNDHGLANPDKYYIITVDAIGNGVSTSPSNTKTQKKSFPRVSMRDMVESEYQLLTQTLKLNHVHAVMGVSMGGMQAFQWIVSHPDFMDKAVTIVGTPKMGTKDILLWTSFLKVIKLPGGGGTDQKKSLLDFADLLPLPEPTAAESEQLMSLFAGMPNTAAEPATDTAAKKPAAGPDLAGAAAFLKKNPLNVLSQFNAIITHDVSKPFGKSLDKAAASVKAPTLVIYATQDKAVSPDIPMQFAELIHAQTIALTGDCGHNAYKCELATISKPIDDFLAGNATPAATKPEPAKAEDPTNFRGLFPTLPKP